MGALLLASCHVTMPRSPVFGPHLQEIGTIQVFICKDMSRVVQGWDGCPVSVKPILLASGKSFSR